MDYSQLSDFEINKRVFKAIVGAKPLGYPHNADGRSVGNEVNGNYRWYDYCNNPADAWPIIEKYRISIINLDEDEWGARGVAYCKSKRAIHENPLRAAMIVFLMMQRIQ
ncbi:DUF2591 family protein [Escherichia coli]|nr:DUF2591 family protein [Escherichia coli]EHT6560046.1 DUF2591 family protein [Escherichia coli]EJD9417483.1 DUF2591 family protein [Escherichia coli]ELT0293615.1 DUF2591 family protein [Escherichia coli]